MQQFCKFMTLTKNIIIFNENYMIDLQKIYGNHKIFLNINFEKNSI